MPATWYDCTRLRQRPRWDAGGGNWYVSQTVPKNGSPTPMYRHKPRIADICGPLMGTSVRKNGVVVGVKYPCLSDRLRIYREGLELVYVFREYRDLLDLAVYRRQVTHRGGMPLDRLFYELACEAQFLPAQWKMLAERMPDRAPIYAECLRHAAILPAALAAE
ncbi:MAG TPA: hypothetical protein VFY28_02990 [Candidatus Paceibacterota bacterium]|nr:hypothetical protein [Candidatus Paceibacterota bacterium]